jgi:hypothetical protein
VCDADVAALLFYVLSIHVCLSKIEREMALLVIRILFVCAVTFEAVALGLFVKWYKFDANNQLDDAHPELYNWLSERRNNPYEDGIGELVALSNVARYSLLSCAALAFVVQEVLTSDTIGRRLSDDLRRSFSQQVSDDSKRELGLPSCLAWLPSFVMRLYVMCFAVFIPVCGMVVLDFYRPSLPPPPHRFSYVVGQDCDGVAGKHNSSELTQGERQCVREYIYARTEDDNAVFFSTYVAVLIFYTLMIVDSIEFIDHPLWVPRVKVLTAGCETRARCAAERDCITRAAAGPDEGRLACSGIRRAVCADGAGSFLRYGHPDGAPNQRPQRGRRRPV